MIKLAALAVLATVAFASAASAQTSRYDDQANIPASAAAAVQNDRLGGDLQTGRSVAVEQPSPETVHSYDFGLKRD